MAKGILIDVGFKSDIKDYINSIEKQFQNVNWGEKIGLSEAFDNQINTTKQKIKELKEEIEKIGTGAAIDGNVQSQLKDVTKSVKVLQDAFQSLVQTMPKAKQNELGVQLKSIKQDLVDTAKVVENVQEVFKGTKDINLVDKNKLNELAQLYKALERARQAAEGFDTAKKKVGNVAYDNTEEILRDIKAQNKLYAELSASYDKISGSRNANKENMLAEKSADMLRSVTEIRQLIASLKTISNDPLNSFSFNITKSITKDLQTLDNEMSLNFDNILQNIANHKARLQSEYNNLGGAGNLSDMFIKATRKLGDSIVFPVTIDPNAKKKLLKESLILIDSVSKKLEDTPIKVEVQLVSAYQSKKNAALIRELQKQVVALEEQSRDAIANGLSEAEAAKYSEVSEQMSKLIARMNKQVDNAMIFTVDIQTEKAIQNIETFAKKVRTELEELINGAPPKIKPEFILTAKAKNALTKEINAFIKETNKQIKKISLEKAKSGEDIFNKYVQQLTGAAKELKELKNLLNNKDIAKHIIEGKSKEFDTLQSQITKDIQVVYNELNKTFDPNNNNLSIWAKTLLDTLNKASNQINNLFNPNSNIKMLFEYLKDINYSDKQKQRYEGNLATLEHGGILLKSGQSIGLTSTDKHDETRYPSLAYHSGINKDDVLASIHSHSGDRIWSPSIILGDIQSALSEGLKYAITNTLEEVATFNVEKFAQDYPNFNLHALESSTEYDISYAITEFENILEDNIKLLAKNFAPNINNFKARNSSLNPSINKLNNEDVLRHMFATRIKFDHNLQNENDVIEKFLELLYPNIKGPLAENKFKQASNNVFQLYRDENNNITSREAYVRFSRKQFENALAVNGIDFAKYFAVQSHEDFAKNLPFDMSKDIINNTPNNIVSLTNALTEVINDINQVDTNKIFNFEDVNNVLSEIKNNLQEIVNILKNVHTIETEINTDVSTATQSSKQPSKAAEQNTVKQEEKTVSKTQQLTEQFQALKTLFNEAYSDANIQLMERYISDMTELNNQMSKSHIKGAEDRKKDIDTAINFLNKKQTQQDVTKTVKASKTATQNIEQGLEKVETKAKNTISAVKAIGQVLEKVGNKISFLDKTGIPEKRTDYEKGNLYTDKEYEELKQSILRNKKNEVSKSITDIMKKRPDLINDLTKEAEQLNKTLSPTEDMIKRITKESNTKNVPLEKMAEEAGKLRDILSTMYKKGTTDTAEFVIAQERVLSLIKKQASSLGGIKGTGSKDTIEMYNKIIKDWERTLKKQGDKKNLNILSDLLLKGKAGEYSVLNGNKTVPIQDLAAKLAPVTAGKGDADKLKTINLILQFIKDNGIKAAEAVEKVTKVSQQTKQVEQVKQTNKTEKSNKQTAAQVEKTTKAIETQGQTFQAEGSVVADVVKGEITELRKLEKVIKTDIPKAIETKNKAFQGERKLVNQVLNAEVKDLNKITKTQEAAEKAKQEEALVKQGKTRFNKYNKQIQTSFAEMLQKDNRTLVDATFKPVKSGLIEINALIKEADDTYKSLVYTTKTGKTFDLEKEKIGFNVDKQADAYEKWIKLQEELAKAPKMIGNIKPNTAVWQQLVNLAEDFGLEMKDIDKIVRNVDHGIESFQFFDKEGNRTTLGINSESILYEKNPIIQISQDVDNFKKKMSDLPKIIRDGITNYDANAGSKYVDTLNQIANLWQKINEYRVMGNISNDEFGGLTQLFGGSAQTIDDLLSAKLPTQNKTPEIIQQVETLKQEFQSLFASIAQNGFSIDGTDDKIANLILRAKELYQNIGLDSSRLAKPIAIDKLLANIGDELNKNTKMSSNFREQLNLLVKEIQDIGHEMPNDKLKEFQARFQNIRSQIHLAGQTGKSFFDQLGTTLGRSVMQFANMYLSLYRLVSYLRQGITEVTNLDKALTTMSYTMDTTSSQIQQMSNDIVNMAKDLSISVDNVAQIYQIYANMQTTAEEIMQTARPTAILANLSGVDASTAADQIQGVLNQFNLLADESMHIVDVYDKISANIAVDYSKGIAGMSDAVRNVGNVAKDAGLSFEQLSAIIGKVMEKTRQDGATIGNALRTIFVRLSKASKLAGDEVDNETLSNASKALHKIGIEVYTAEGEFREFDTIIGELAAKWNQLTDAEQANISFSIAATRQTSMLRAVLDQYSGAMELAAEATETEGNALANQLKYEESIAGRTQALKNELSQFWINTISSDSIKNIISELTKFIGELNDANSAASALVKTITGLLSSVLSIMNAIPSGGALGALLGLTKGRNLFTSVNPEGGFNIKSLFGVFGTTVGKNTLVTQNDVKLFQDYVGLLKSGTDQSVAFDKAMSGATVQAQNMAQSVTVVDGSIKGAKTTLVAMKAQMIATKVAATALNVALTMGLTIGVSLLVKAIDNWVHAEENARKEMAETTKAAQNDTKEFNTRIAQIEELTEKYKEYNTQLKNSKTIDQEYVQIHSDLLDVQKDLNEQFGETATKLDLINDGYDKNAIKIQRNIQLLREQYLAEHADAYTNAKKLQDEKWLQESLGEAGLLTVSEEQKNIELSYDAAYGKIADIKLKQNYIIKDLLKEYGYETYKGTLDEFRTSMNKLITDFVSEDIDFDVLAKKYYISAEELQKTFEDIKSAWSTAINNPDSYINTAIGNQDFINQYDKQLLYNDAQYSKLYSEFEGLVQNYQEAVQEQNHALVIDIGNQIYDFITKTGPFDELPDEFAKFFKELFWEYANTAVDFIPEAQNILKEIFAYSDWLNEDSSVKNGDKNYSNNELINSYKSSLNQLKDYIVNNREGKIEVDFGEIIQTTASDELFKALNMDGFENYIKKYGEEYTAIFAYIQDAEDNLKNNLEMDTEDKNILLRTLHNIKIEAFGGTNSIYKLRDSYKELKGETDSSISKSFTKLSEGMKLTYDEMTELINKYPELKNAVIKYSNDSYSVQKENIDDLISEYAGLSNEYVSNMKEMYEATIHVAWAQIGLYRSIEETKKIYHDALDSRGPLNNIFGANTGKVIEAIKFLEELEGIQWYPEGGGNNDKNTDNKSQFDWLDSYLDKRARDISDLQTKYEQLKITILDTDNIESSYYSSLNKNLKETNKALDAEIAAQKVAQQELEGRLSSGLIYNDAVTAFGSKEKADKIIAQVKKQYLEEGRYDLSEYTSDQQSALSAIMDTYIRYLETTNKIAEDEAKKAENTITIFKNKIESITTAYDHVLNEFENRQRELEHYQTMQTTKGMLENQQYYLALFDNESRSLQANIKERNELIKQLNKFDVTNKAEMDQWWETKQAINETTASIYENEEAIESLKMSMQQLKWDLSDKIREIHNGITTETDFLISDLSSLGKDMYSYVREFLGNDAEKTKLYSGQMSNEGISILGLRGINLEHYEEELAEFEKEIEQAEQDYLANPASITYLDRLTELRQQRNDMIQSYNDEKQAIVDLIKEGYDKQLESLDALTSKYMEALQAEKDYSLYSPL